MIDKLACNIYSTTITPNTTSTMRKRKSPSSSTMNDDNVEYVDIRSFNKSSIDMKTLGWNGGVLKEETIRQTSTSSLSSNNKESTKRRKLEQQQQTTTTSPSEHHHGERITIPISTRTDLQTTSKKLLEEYKLVAVCPLSPDAMTWIIEACESPTTTTFDLISIHLNESNSIVPRAAALKTLTKAGIYLEISIRDLLIRADTLPTLHQRITSGKTLIKHAHRRLLISTGATNDNECRSVHEVQTICETLLKMHKNDIVDGMTSRVKELRQVAARRRSAFGIALF
jgi:RNase P/RNase MRP subunit p30